jgi:acylphosphatase
LNGDTRVELRIRGLVQGVTYRASAREAARELGLTGWVRNEVDGSVSAVAEGPRDRLDQFVAWCHHGPVGAEVDGVETRFGPATGEFAGFTVRR